MNQKLRELKRQNPYRARDFGQLFIGVAVILSWLGLLAWFCIEHL